MQSTLLENLTLFGARPSMGILLAILLGAFLGIRREIESQRRKNKSFMGVRTMTILCTIGAVSAVFPEWPYLPMVFFGAIMTLLSIAYAHGSFRMDRIGITTELSAILTFWIGVMCTSGMQKMALALAIFVAILNAYKMEMKTFIRTLTDTEWRGALQLLIVSGIVLPLLPQEPIDPWGVFVPFQIWTLVILISGIGFVGYFLTKYFGAKAGIPLTAFLGAIVSSTAVTASMAEESKSNNIKGIFTVGILIALATMQVRVFFEVVLLGTHDMRTEALFVPLIMAGAALVSAGFAFMRFHKPSSWRNLFQREPENLTLASPFEILPAIKFGVVFAAVLFALYFGQKYLGDSGVYMAAFLSGVIDIDAIVLSSLESVRLSELTPQVAQNAILIALFMNTMIKIGFVGLLGSRQLLKEMSLSVLCVCVAGGIAYAFVSFL